MLTTPKTPDYVGTQRHECPECARKASVRRLICRDTDWNIISDIAYCESSDCDWEEPQ